MSEKDRLLEQLAQFVGFGFMAHPTMPGYFLQLSFYKFPVEWVICMSEGKGSGNKAIARQSLGELVPGDLIAPFAIRGIQGDPLPDFETFKTLINDSFLIGFPEMKLEWYKHKPL